MKVYMIRIIDGTYLHEHLEPLVFTHHFSAEKWVKDNGIPTGAFIKEVEAR
jgi:hypothetical protein